MTVEVCGWDGKSIARVFLCLLSGWEVGEGGRGGRGAGCLNSGWCGEPGIADQPRSAQGIIALCLIWTNGKVPIGLPQNPFWEPAEPHQNATTEGAQS